MFAHQVHSQTEFHVLNVPQVNFMLTVDAIVQMVLSSMESNAQSKQLTTVLEFQILTGTELTVSASQVSQLTETHAIVTVS